MKILVKYPTRHRPHFFIKNVTEYSEKTSDKSNVQWLVSYDLDDTTMTDKIREESYKLIPNIQFVQGKSDSKIHAVNRDIELIKDWDILVVVSDDMWVQCGGWDELIREEMKKNFPDTDGCLWFHDGTEQKRISTLSVIGRKYYDKFGYVYYPGYKSFFCDNEYTEVAMRDKKMVFIDTVIARHEHPDWAGKITGKDELYRKNDSFWEHDEKLYNSRKALNFPK